MVTTIKDATEAIPTVSVMRASTQPFVPSIMSAVAQMLAPSIVEMAPVAPDVMKITPVVAAGLVKIEQKRS